jgi:hypothetical protein
VINIRNLLDKGVETARTDLRSDGVATDLRHPQRNDLPDKIHFTLASLTILVKPELITTTDIPTWATFILISKSSKEVVCARFLASDGGRFV